MKQHRKYISESLKYLKLGKQKQLSKIKTYCARGIQLFFVKFDKFVCYIQLKRHFYKYLFIKKVLNNILLQKCLFLPPLIEETKNKINYFPVKKISPGRKNLHPSIEEKISDNRYNYFSICAS